MKWAPKMVTFDQAFEDQTSGQVKIQRGDYLPGGLLPVIDQGQKPIAGYSDNPDHAYQGPLPVILFGDHTLSLKHVNFSFALGADGVRVLASRPPFLSKILYYYLTSLNIKSHGYMGHSPALPGAWAKAGKTGCLALGKTLDLQGYSRCCARERARSRGLGQRQGKLVVWRWEKPWICRGIHVAAPGDGRAPGAWAKALKSCRVVRLLKPFGTFRMTFLAILT